MTAKISIQILSQPTKPIDKPIVSIAVEGYNESHAALSSMTKTLDALALQDFSLDDIEVLLIGTHEQVEQLHDYYQQRPLNFLVKTVAVEGDPHYWEIKNIGIDVATGDIIALTDSDVTIKPTWLSAIISGIGNNADVVVGPSLFQSKNFCSDTPLMLTAASISWGFMVGNRINGQNHSAFSVMAHNIAMPAAIFRRHRFRTDLKRSFVSTFLYAELLEAGMKIVLQPKQQVAHEMTFRWWLLIQRFRWGWENHIIKQADKNFRYNKWVDKLGYLTPLLTKVWHVYLDVPQWFRYSHAVGLGIEKQFLYLPVLLLMSTLARATEMVGMYVALIAPNAKIKKALF